MRTFNGLVQKNETHDMKLCECNSIYRVSTVCLLLVNCAYCSISRVNYILKRNFIYKFVKVHLLALVGII